MVSKGKRPFEPDKRIRAIVYYEDLSNRDFMFLLGFRYSDLPGWEFIKGGFDPNRDKTIEDTLYNEMKEETKGIITKEIFIGEPKFIDVKDAISFTNVIEGVRTYKVKVRNDPPPIVKPSIEHCRFAWWNTLDTKNLLEKRSTYRLRDYYTFCRILEIDDEFKIGSIIKKLNYI